MIPDHVKQMSPMQRLEWLEANADETEEKTYQKRISDDDRSFLNHDLAENLVELNRKEDELKAVKENYKEIMDPIKTEIKNIVSKMRTGAEEVTDTVYHLRDYDKQRVYEYDRDGNEILTRPMKAEERQLVIKALRAVNHE